MKRLLILLILVAPTLLPAEKYSQDGAHVTVTELPREKGFRVFDVKVTNGRFEPLAVAGVISIHNPREFAGQAGICEIFVEVAYAQREDLVVRCRESQASTVWTFDITKVYYGEALIKVRKERAAASSATEQNQNGVRVRVSRIPDTIKGFSGFAVAVENTTSVKRSLNARILLGKGGESGQCTVFIKLGAGEKKTQTKQCKGQSDVWSFQIVKVYDF